MKKHPIQPIEKDEHGVARFKENAIVRYLLDAGPFNMNDLACRDFSREDAEQFAQLIGYSLSGAGELSYVSDDMIETADRMYAQGETEQEARLGVVEDKLALVREHFKELVPELFNIHEDDLEE